MSVIVFSDWNNYTEDGVPKVLDWNNLSLYGFRVPLTALVYAINERYNIHNNISNTTLSVSLNSLNSLYTTMFDIQNHVENIANFYVDRQINLDNTSLYQNPNPSILVTTVAVGTPPSIGNKIDLNSNILHGDMMIAWCLEQKQIIDNSTLFDVRLYDYHVNIFFQLGKIEVITRNTIDKINLFNATMPTWLTNSFFIAHKGGASDVYAITRYGFRLNLLTGLSLQCKKSIYMFYRREIVFQNNDTNILEDKAGYYIKDMNISNIDDTINTFDYHKTNTLQFDSNQYVGFHGEYISMFLDFKVPGGFKFI